MSLDKDGLTAAARAFGKKAPRYWLDVRDADVHVAKSLTAAITAYLTALPNTGDELVAELRAYEHWEGQTNLGTDCYGHPEICDRAAAAVISLTSRAQAAEASLASAREALEQMLRCEYESAEPGLCDCVDNAGKPYQSQHLANSIKVAESAIRSLTGVSSNG